VDLGSGGSIDGVGEESVKREHELTRVSMLYFKGGDFKGTGILKGRVF
jgi:hypothetical protein